MMAHQEKQILVINWQDITHPMGGGAEVHCHEIFKRVACKGVNVTLLCCHYPGAKHDEWLDGIRIIRRGNRSTFNFTVPFAYHALRKQMRFDVVFDDVNKIPFCTPLFVKEPLWAIAHHLFRKSIYLEAGFLAASYVYISEYLIPLVYRHTPFAVVSESTRQELVEFGVRGPVTLLPNAVDAERYEYRPELRSTEPLIGYLGRLKKYKRIDHLLVAFSRVLSEMPSARLLIVGGGDDLSRLESLAIELNVADKVTFTGHVSHKAQVHHINRMWLVANPSSKEGWGLTVIEANACGVPVVAADSPGLRDSVVDQKTGVLYPYGDITELSKHLLLLLKHSELRKKLGKQSRQWADSFTWDRSAQIAMDLIDKSCKRRTV